MSNQTIHLHVLLLLVSSITEASEDSKIPERLLNDPYLMVKEAAATSDVNLTVWKHIRANPDLYRQPVIEMASKTEDVPTLVMLADLAELVLPAEQSRAIARKALEKLPENSTPLVEETRRRLMTLSKEETRSGRKEGESSETSSSFPSSPNGRNQQNGQQEQIQQSSPSRHVKKRSILDWPILALIGVSLLVALTVFWYRKGSVGRSH